MSAPLPHGASQRSSGVGPEAVGLETIERQMRKIHSSLLQRHSDKLGVAVIETLVVHYAFGLLDAYGDSSWPQAQAEMLETLAGEVLGPASAARALDEVPPVSTESLGRMIRTAEAAGRLEGDVLRISAGGNAGAADLPTLPKKRVSTPDASAALAMI